MLALLVVGCTTDGEPGAPRSTVLEDEHFVLDAVTAEGLIAEVSSLDSEVVVVNFWASWCAPCREEFPDFIRFAGEHDDVQLRFVSVDLIEDLSYAADFLREQGVRGTTFIAIGAEGLFREAIGAEWSGAIPATVIFDGAGNRLDFWEGKVSYDTLAERVRRARSRS